MIFKITLFVISEKCHKVCNYTYDTLTEILLIVFIKLQFSLQSKLNENLATIFKLLIAWLQNFDLVSVQSIVIFLLKMPVLSKD